MGVEVCGLLLGGKGVGDAMAKELGASGADKVLVVEDDLLETYTTDAYAKVICDTCLLYTSRRAAGTLLRGAQFAPCLHA